MKNVCPTRSVLPALPLTRYFASFTGISSLVQSFNGLQMEVDTEVSITGGALGNLKFTKTKLGNMPAMTVFRAETCPDDNVRLHLLSFQAP